MGEKGSMRYMVLYKVHLSDHEGMGILAQLLWSATMQQLETPPPAPQVHLSDHEGMGILAQLLWSAAMQQLETPPPAPQVSPRPSQPLRKFSPKLVVVGDVLAPRSPDPFQWRTARQGSKVSQPGKPSQSQQQEKECSFPLNPVWFSSATLRAMEEVSPSTLSRPVDCQPSPKPKRVASSALAKRPRTPRSNRSSVNNLVGSPPARSSWRSGNAETPCSPPVAKVVVFFRQYMPSKPAKYGIKSWVACDAKSSYAWKMQVYTGKPTSGCPEKTQGMRVVLDVTEGLRGHNVTCDNFFTSYELGQQLLKRKITMVGTVRKNKPELPPALLASKEREVFSSKFAFTPMTTVVSYLPKKNKNVVLMSTLHKDSDISDREDRKPVNILDNNRNKKGVDNLDKVIGTYSCRRMTARWPLVIFHNIIDVSSYNAFVIWREINPTWISHKKNKWRVFLEQLGKALVTPLIERRKHVPRTEASAAVVKAIQSAGAPDKPEDPATTATSLAKASKRKRCQFCP
ncbi:hypothetical protein D5F01_LYC02844 [Larimichthys crocea]|uniref:PiggyBac transposable element-derived protein domain-containing protein n=1 Tax=Larimichthys crocea TaxID=215358 RepID=A0A6G0J3S1_LARCR|nr:hypothetical protein D5F01_LYC02844 [Larimichthys crocea]